MSTSLRKIGQLANVSNVTVMRALRGDSSVRPELQQQIKEIAAQLRYEPNLLAKGLLHGRTATVAILVPRTDATSLSRVIRAAQEVLLERGYRAIVLNSDDRIDLEYEEIRQAAMRRVDGMLMIGARDFVGAEHVEELRKRRIPLVLMNRPLANVRAHVFTGMDEHAGYSLTRKLLERGHQRIGHIGGPDTEEPSIQRRTSGWERALREAALNPKEMPVFNCWWTDVDPIAKEVREWFKRPNRPTAIFCSSEIQASGVYRAAYHSGLRIGEDVAVVSFLTSGGSGLSKYLTPTLAGLVAPGFEIGREAAKCLIDLIEKKRAPDEEPKLQELPFEWQEGESIGGVQIPETSNLGAK